MIETSRISIRTGASLPDAGWGWETSRMPQAWPWLGPTWVRATERALPEVRPWHTVATRRDDEVAWLPGFIFDRPPGVDFDPRTYLGWQPPSGDQVCCGSGGCSDSAAEVDAVGEAAFFPAMVLGTPLGYRSEVATTFSTPDLRRSLAASAIRSALAGGVRTVVAPWIPDWPENMELIDGVARAGGHVGFWGCEDFLPLESGTYEGHLASLNKKQRYRVRQDQERLAAAGVTIDRLDGAAIRPLVARIAELTCASHEKNGAGEEPSHITTILGALLDAGADVRCYAAHLRDAVVGICVTIRKGERLFIKWAGFDYGVLGERSGVYFPLVLDAPVRDAYAEGLRWVECGAGAHQAKALRGARPRRYHIALLAADASLRPMVARLLDGFSGRRRAAFDLAEPAAGACCP